MRKGVVLLGMLSSALVVMGCSFSQQAVPQEEMLSHSGEQLTQVFTGGTCDTPNLAELQKPIPPCEPLDIKPFPEADIKNIEDVARNCKYQKGHFFYAPFWGGGGGRSPLYLWKNFITGPVWHEFSSERGKSLCVFNGDEYQELTSPREKEGEVFIRKHDLQDNPYFSFIYPYIGDEDEIVIQQMTKCEEIELCRDLVPKVRGDNEHHFFFHTQASMTWEVWDPIVVVDNKKVYRLGTSRESESYNEITERSARVVHDLVGDKMIVKRLTNWKLIEPYRSNTSLIDTEENYNAAVDGKHLIIGTFDLETCEIQL